MEVLFAFVLYVQGHTYIADHDLTFEDCISELFDSRAKKLRREFPESSMACVAQK